MNGKSIGGFEWTMIRTLKWLAIRGALESVEDECWWEEKQEGKEGKRLVFEMFVEEVWKGC